MTRRYSTEPTDPEDFTRRFDRFYTRFAPVYDALVKVGPVWKSWLSRALPHAEMSRVLKPGCDLVLIDVGYPDNQNKVGTLLTEIWRKGGDLIRDVDSLLREAGFDYQKEAIGGFGSVHLYVATKR